MKRYFIFSILVLFVVVGAFAQMQGELAGKGSDFVVTWDHSTVWVYDLQGKEIAHTAYATKITSVSVRNDIIYVYKQGQSTPDEYNKYLRFPRA